MTDENGTTTIVIKRELRDKLAALGGKDDSFNDIIEKLVYFHTRYKGVVEREK